MRNQDILNGPFGSALLAVAILFAAVISFVPAKAAGPAIDHILVINLENEAYDTTFGPNSEAKYLNKTLLSQGELIVNWFATSHASLGNYIAEVSGQGPTPMVNDDCFDLQSPGAKTGLGAFKDVVPGTAAPDTARYPGQVFGDGCVFPAPTASAHGVRTIGDQLDEKYGQREFRPNAPILWRDYSEDMGNDTARDYGSPDPAGGADCSHPPIGGEDKTNRASSNDQYADRHNPFIYFHSVIDNAARCNAHVVPLGRVTVGHDGKSDEFSGHLYEDLQRPETTPHFMFVSPNLCNDGHDETCNGPNTEGTKDAKSRGIGGLEGADLWLKHWMPMILGSPAYKAGRMLVVLTFDESDIGDPKACPAADQATCAAPSGPNVTDFGHSEILERFGRQKAGMKPGTYPGGGQIGAVLFNAKYIAPGTINKTGYYTHFSGLRSYEDLLGIDTGGDDGHGHLGYAARPNLATFGPDVFTRKAD